MSEKQKKTSRESMLNFFKDESAALIDPSINQNETGRVKETSFKSADSRPVLKAVDQAPEEEIKSWWRSLRQFFQTSEGGGLRAHNKKLKPLNMASGGAIAQRYINYPFWIDDVNTGESCTLRQMLAEAMAEEEGQAMPEGILRQKIDGLIAETELLLEADEMDFNFIPLLTKAAKNLAAKLNLQGTDQESFEKDFVELLKNLPDHGILLRKSGNSYYQLLAAAMILDGNSKKAALLAEISDSIARLNDLLVIQAENTEAASDPEHLKSAFGESEDMLDLEKLSSLLPTGATELMPADRIARIKAVVETLSGAGQFLKQGDRILMQKDLYAESEEKIAGIFTPVKIVTVTEKNGGQKILQVFREAMSRFEAIIAALRIAELELNNSYDPEFHGVFFTRFSWRLITQKEMRAFPALVLMLDSLTLAQHNIKEFSSILSKNIPVKFLLFRNIDTSTYSNDELLEEAFESLELGSMAVSYRNTFVMQASALTPQYLYQGFVNGLEAPSAAVFYVLQDEDEQSELWSSAAVESRAFPGFIFNGKQGTDWGSRFNIIDNPQPQKNWPVYTVDIHDEAGQWETLEVPFTYADYKALNIKYDSEFKVVPRQYWTADLIDLAGYLDLNEKDQYSKIPCIWMVDEQNLIQKVAVSWEMLSMTFEKLDFWHFIQENGGVNSFHVHQALEQEKLRLQQEAEKQVIELQESHARELAKVKDETASEAMERLTSLLLDLDTNAIIPSNPAAAAPVQVEDTPVVEEQEAEQIEEEESLSMDEPWLETPLCTTCNECTELNGMMFKYNADKMAYIADPKAGTYAQLVEAAEKCPVHIIHPGKPLNPDEPDLESLIKRAEKFN
jgi:ferredoxin